MYKYSVQTLIAYTLNVFCKCTPKHWTTIIINRFICWYLTLRTNIIQMLLSGARGCLSIASLKTIQIMHEKSFFPLTAKLTSEQLDPDYASKAMGKMNI